MRSDEQLEESVSTAFSEYGKCYVKIRRDKNHMPYAFVQYEVRRSFFATILLPPTSLTTCRKSKMLRRQSTLVVESKSTVALFVLSMPKSIVRPLYCPYLLFHQRY